MKNIKLFLMIQISTNAIVLIFALVLFFYNSASLNIKLSMALFFWK